MLRFMEEIVEIVGGELSVNKTRLLLLWWRSHASCPGFVHDPRAAKWSTQPQYATRVGLRFPFRPERGRGAPSVAMKWVKAAIMHGPVTLDAPCWWQLGLSLKPCMAPVPLKGRRDMSVGPPAKRTHMRVADKAKLWFVDFHAHHARVRGKFFGPVGPNTFRRWDDGGAPNADPGSRPTATSRPFAHCKPGPEAA